MGEPYIKLEHVFFSYEEEETGKEKQYAVRDVSLEIEKGKFIAILGHNGSGKSTLAKLIGAVLVPDRGKICVGDTCLTNPDMTDEELLLLRRKVGMVFQNPDNQLVATVVEEDVAFGPENLGYPPAEIRRRVDEAMEVLGISEYARHAPSKLSGGQKQRVAIAGLLAMQPECMIFDEATAMLDPMGRREVMDIIRKLNKELGITVLHITHNMDEAIAADRIVVIDDGICLKEGTPKEIFSDVQTMHSIGLDVPEGTELLYELERQGAEVDHGCLGIEECAQMIYNCYKKQL